METRKTYKPWQQAADRFHKQRLAHAKERQPLIVKWRWVKEKVAGLLMELQK